MHWSVDDWVGRMIEAHDLADKAVVEFGSMCVNGSVRPRFSGRYLGIDLEAGEGVDAVYDTDYPLFDHDFGSFDVALSTEMLEHCRKPWMQLRNMYMAVNPGGYLLLTCRGFNEHGSFFYHAHPEDNWRFSDHALESLCESAGWKEVEVTPDPSAHGWFVYARKT